MRSASFTGAARELSVTQGAVSRQISELENWLSTTLFNRTRRGIEPTLDRELFAAVRNAFEQIEHTVRQLQQRRTERTLRLKLPPTFAIRWLVPRLSNFLAANHSVDIQITTSHHQDVDLEREDVDFAIHYGPDPLPSFQCQPLFRDALLPVCSPSLFKRTPGLSKPADLTNHVLLCSLNRPQDWPIWLGLAGLSDVDGNSGLKFESSALACQAAIDGLGIVIAQRVFVSDDLKSGRLIAPFDLCVPTPSLYYLTRSATRPSHRSVEVFEAWIKDQAYLMEDAYLNEY